jgi:hypothetical protein
MEQSPSAKLQFIVGDIGYAFNNDIGIFYDFIGHMQQKYDKTSAIYTHTL